MFDNDRSWEIHYIQYHCAKMMYSLNLKLVDLKHFHIVDEMVKKVLDDIPVKSILIFSKFYSHNYKFHFTTTISACMFKNKEKKLLDASMAMRYKIVAVKC